VRQISDIDDTDIGKSPKLKFITKLSQVVTSRLHVYFHECFRVFLINQGKYKKRNAMWKTHVYLVCGNSAYHGTLVNLNFGLVENADTHDTVN